MPLTKGKDLQLGILLNKFQSLHSLQVRFQALTASSIEALKDFPQLRRLDLVVDSLYHDTDKAVVSSIFALTHLEKLRLDVGHHTDEDWAEFAWTKLAKLQQLTFAASYSAPQAQYDFMSVLTGLQNLHLLYSCPTTDCLSCLSKLTCLNVHVPQNARGRLLPGLHLITGLRSLKIDGVPFKSSLLTLTALSELTSLGFWPDPYRFGCISKCPVRYASRLCRLRKLQHLRCAFVDGDKFVSAQLTHKSTYRKPMTMPGSPITICFNLWKA